MTEALDLRLAVGVLVGWAAVLWGLGRSAAVVGLAVLGALLAAAVLAIGAAACGVGPRWRPVLHAGAFAACCAAVLLAPLAVRLHAAHDGELARLARTGAQVSAELRVRDDPRPLGADSSNVAVDAELRSVLYQGRWRAVSGSVLVFGRADGWRGVLPGQRVRVAGRLSPPRPGNLLAATVLARSAPQPVGRPPWWQRAAGRLRAGLRQASAGLPVLPRGLLPGLVDGDTSNLDPVLAERFRVAGLTHLVAVSGTNLSLLIGTVALLLRRMRVSPVVLALVSTVVLVGFVVLARPSPSVLRAAGMAGIALVALATGRQRAALPVLAAASFGLLLWQPELAVSAGFALSVVATAALLLIAPGWVQALRRRRVPAGLAESLAVAAAAHLVTAPIIAGLSGQVSLVAIPANVLAEPVVAAVTILGLLAALASVLWLPLAVLLAQLAGLPCRWLVWVAEYFGTLPGSSLPWPAGVRGGLLLAGVTAGLAVLCRRPAARALLGVAVLLGVLIQIPGRAVLGGWPPPGWLIAACDVGQGDALVLNAGSGSAVVVDAGPDPVPVDRCLHGLGVHRIAVLVLSHDHLDHVGGLAGVLHERQVDRVLGSPLPEPASGSRLIEKMLAGLHLRVEQAHVGQRLDAGQVHLDVLGPGHVFAGSRSDPNNSSVVLRATVAGVRILLPGDAEVEAQDDLLANGTDLRADILKVAHHGSAYSDPRFLQASQARLALISVGAGNDYGHPSPVLIAELDRLGMPYARTDQQGDIAVVSRDGRLVPVVRSTGIAAGRGGLTLPRRQPLPSARAPPLWACATKREAPGWRGRSPKWPGCRESVPGRCGTTTRSA
ncbi:MAG: ComEC/Rec2 family competence protein, partial [Actinobacteria bacterium]|nr:ComEC/Rec2 family competence protein [Actinomycetota bacterium]